MNSICFLHIGYIWPFWGRAGITYRLHISFVCVCLGLFVFLFFWNRTRWKLHIDYTFRFCVGLFFLFFWEPSTFVSIALMCTASPFSFLFPRLARNSVARFSHLGRPQRIHSAIFAGRQYYLVAFSRTVHGWARLVAAGTHHGRHRQATIPGMIFFTHRSPYPLPPIKISPTAGVEFGVVEGLGG